MSASTSQSPLLMATACRRCATCGRRPRSVSKSARSNLAWPLRRLVAAPVACRALGCLSWMVRRRGTVRHTRARAHTHTHTRTHTYAHIHTQAQAQAQAQHTTLRVMLPRSAAARWSSRGRGRTKTSARHCSKTSCGRSSYRAPPRLRRSSGSGAVWNQLQNHGYRTATMPLMLSLPASEKERRVREREGGRGRERERAAHSRP